MAEPMWYSEKLTYENRRQVSLNFNGSRKFLSSSPTGANTTLIHGCHLFENVAKIIHGNVLVRFLRLTL